MRNVGYLLSLLLFGVTLPPCHSSRWICSGAPCLPLPSLIGTNEERNNPQHDPHESSLAWSWLTGLRGGARSRVTAGGGSRDDDGNSPVGMSQASRVADVESTLVANFPNRVIVDEAPEVGLEADNEDGVAAQDCALMSPSKMETLEIFPGDTILLRGRRRRETLVVAQPDPDLDSDGSGNRMRISRQVRRNLRCHLGDTVSVLGAPPVKDGTFVKVVPYKDDVENVKGDLIDNLLSPHFSGAFRPLHVGDTFIARAGLLSVEFRVEEIRVLGAGGGDDGDGDGESGMPADFCVVTDDTVIDCEGDPINREDDDRLNEVGYDQVGGCGRQVDAIRELIELPLRHPEIFNKVGVPAPRGVLLYGPPGCGKTLLARAVIAETGAHLVRINGPDIMGKVSGESETNLRKAFEEAEENAPSIVFIDEVDSVAPKRDKAGGETEKRIVSQLLTLMDSIKPTSHVVVIAATNRPNVIDSALRRFGRFDRELDIGIPDEQGRLEVLRIKTRDMKLAADINLLKVAKDTHGFVGADIAQLCMEAALACIAEKEMLEAVVQPAPEAGRPLTMFQHMKSFAAVTVTYWVAVRAFASLTSFARREGVAIWALVAGSLGYIALSTIFVYFVYARRCLSGRGRATSVFMATGAPAASCASGAATDRGTQWTDAAARGSEEKNGKGSGARRGGRERRGGGEEVMERLLGGVTGPLEPHAKD